MVQLIRCDKCNKDLAYDESYSVDTYNRSTNVHAKIDLCHECFMLSILKIHQNTIDGGAAFYGKLSSITVTWKQWNKETKKFETVVKPA